jgi:hypothetical protein
MQLLALLKRTALRKASTELQSSAELIWSSRRSRCLGIYAPLMWHKVMLAQTLAFWQRPAESRESSPPRTTMAGTLAKHLFARLPHSTPAQHSTCRRASQRAAARPSCAAHGWNGFASVNHLCVAFCSPNVAITTLAYSLEHYLHACAYNFGMGACERVTRRAASMPACRRRFDVPSFMHTAIICVVPTCISFQ